MESGNTVNYSGLYSPLLLSFKLRIFHTREEGRGVPNMGEGTIYILEIRQLGTGFHQVKLGDAVM